MPQIIINGETFDASTGIAAYLASDGVVIHPDSLAQMMGYDVLNRLTSISVVSNGNTYVQSITYVGITKNVATLSAWVKQ